MVKRRKKIQKATEKKEKKLPEPDPNSEDYFYDEVDKFHRNKDKIFLDKEKEEKQEQELEESEDEEVLGIDSGEDSEDEVEEQEDEDDDDLLGLDESGDTGLPSDQAWGRSKKQFYDADVDEGDVYASDEEGELAAQEEEEEALTLQKRMASRLDEEDFYTIEQEDEAEVGKVEEPSVTKDLSKLSKRERLQILTKQSPDLLPLMNEYQESLNELKMYYTPLLKLSQEENTPMTSECKTFIKTKHHLLMNYLVNISFYLALKAKKEDLKAHPIVDVLYKHRELLSQMKETHNKLIAEYKHMQENPQQEEKKEEEEESTTVKTTTKDATALNGVKKKSDGKKKKKTKVDKEKDEDDSELNVDPLEYYNSIKKEIEKKKQAKQLGNEEEEEEDKEEKEEFDEDGKRMITYEMSKNKGLIRQRRKELRNPRVKHKMKFKKAKIKHKGQVREIRNEQNRYGGETTGIKATLSRSVRIK